ncbi:MAG: tetratricopeptide repeat protein [Flavobacterium sp.]|nr:tetratricopeptide repeat protein [Flavobacterium sp.]
MNLKHLLNIVILLLYFNSYSQKEEILLYNTYRSTLSEIMDFTIKNNSSEINTIKYIESKRDNYKDIYFKTIIDLLISGKYLNIDLNKAKYYYEKNLSFIVNSDYQYLKIYQNTLKQAINQLENNKLLIYKNCKKNIEKLKPYREIDKLIGLEMWNTTMYINSLLNNNRNEEAINELISLEKNLTPEENIEIYCYALSQLGYYHYQLNNYKEAELKYKRVIELLENNEAKYYNILLSAYNNLGAIQSKFGKDNQSIITLQKGLDIATKEEIIDQQANLNKSISSLYIRKNKFNLGEKYAKKALELSYKINNSEFIAICNNNLSTIYLKTNQIKKGLESVDKVIKYFKSNINNANIKSLHKALNTKRELLLIDNKYKELIELDSYLIKLLDSINHNNNVEILNEKLISYETNKKETEITILKQNEKIQNFELEKQKQVTNLSIIGSIILFTITLIIFLYQKKINTIKNLALRSKLMRSQFNPHYINNAFTSLQATLIEHDLDESLINYTSDISRFSRLLLESTFKDEWTLFEEKQMMEHYLKTQQHRYENNFEFTISNNFSNDELHKYKLPSALTQTVLENAIEHGGYQNNNGGKIEISIQKMSNQFEIIIKNNKIGEEAISSKKVNNEPSRGLEITKQRMELHQKIHKTKTEFKFKMKENEVLVTFVLPLLNA